ncbi:MAG: beta-galactosidase [Clostridia bacterium]|nr:beta-galactosidase [Clostridia bacterium]
MKQADRIYYGGDYNPDQWDAATVAEDMRLFRQAGINLLTLPVFSWARLEPEEGVYDFGWLDAIIDRIWESGIRVCLATPTAAQPAWLSTRYPEVLPVDIQGRRRTHGMRVFFCVNSLKYRERAAAIAHEFGRRYAHHPALAMWHVANEYGTSCYCPACQAKFRLWLRQRYGGIEALNARWNTAFWGRTVYSFEEIALPTELNDDYRFNPAVQLDYMRFLTDSTIECFNNERDVLKSYNPEIPVLTNTSGFIKKLDQFAFARNLDAVGWDNYPWPQDPPHFVAMKHDIMRGLKDGQSFVLAEQSPNQQNWQPYNRLKRPGEVRLLSYQAMAHGADTCLFFQMRQSAAGQEKFHGAIIGHSGRSDTRVFREAEALGRELAALGDRFLRARTPARVAFLMDWNSWWALELASGPSRDMEYLKTLSAYYRPFYARNIAVDFVDPAPDTDYSGYALVVAPMLYMTKPGVAEALTEYVRGGGRLLATVMTGLVDENDRCVFGAYPGKLRDAMGIWVEETDALRPDEGNGLAVCGPLKLPRERYDCGFLCDVLHAESAEALAVYEDDFYAGTPCVTRNRFGAGTAWYVGTQPEDAFLDDLTDAICREAGIEGLFASEPSVEATRRVGERGATVFLLNHNAHPAHVDLGGARLVDLLTGETLTGRVELPGRGVRVCREL